jgi:hypothetical protein
LLYTIILLSYLLSPLSSVTPKLFIIAVNNF